MIIIDSFANPLIIPFQSANLVWFHVISGFHKAFAQIEANYWSSDFFVFNKWLVKYGHEMFLSKNNLLCFLEFGYIYLELLADGKLVVYMLLYFEYVLGLCWSVMCFTV
jgi:hypothetical protein